jgi:hypothetical protein
MNEILQLRERAKELRCLYRVNEAVSRRGQPPARTFLSVLESIPDGWQRPETTGARIEYLGRSFVGPGYSTTGRSISEPIRLHDVVVGRIEVSDRVEGVPAEETFLAEERELLRTIALRLGEYLEWKHTELLGERVTPASVHWRWREIYAQAIAAHLDHERFGVSALFICGSTESGQAGPASDIDLLVEFHGTAEQRDKLLHWLEGWSLCLAELSFQQTGYDFPGGILNVQLLQERPNLTLRPDLRELRLGA